MKAFILVKLNKTKEKYLVEKLNSLKYVKHAYVLFGEWDLVVEVEVENADALGTFVMDHIRKQDEVDLTSTLIVAK